LIERPGALRARAPVIFLRHQHAQMGHKAASGRGLQTREVGGLLTLKPSGISAYCIGNVGWVADESLFTLGSGVALRVRPRDRTRALAQFAKSAFPPRDRRFGSRAEIRSRSSTPPTAVLASCAAYRSFNTGSSLIYSAVTAQECAVKQLVELARGGLPKAELARSYKVSGEAVYQYLRGGPEARVIGASVASRREDHREE